MKKNLNKPISKKRVSKRRYPSRICRNQDCKIIFTPTDARQYYCVPQHRVDWNNDLRKIKNVEDKIFIKKIKTNYKALNKIFKSPFYVQNESVHFSLLDYEGYDLTIYHSKFIDDKSGRDILKCYDYGLECIDIEANYYRIHKI
jgi:hypothetical protein